MMHPPLHHWHEAAQCPMSPVSRIAGNKKASVISKGNVEMSGLVLCGDKEKAVGVGVHKLALVLQQEHEIA